MNCCWHSTLVSSNLPCQIAQEGIIGLICRTPEGISPRVLSRRQGQSLFPPKTSSPVNILSAGFGPRLSTGRTGKIGGLDVTVEVNLKHAS